MKESRKNRGGKELRRLKIGFEARVRFCGKRRGFALPKALDEAAARERLSALGEFASRLSEVTDVTEVEKLLELAAAAKQGRAFETVATAINLVCNGNAPAKGEAPLTFAEFAQQWTRGELHRKFPDHCPYKKTHQLDADRLRLYIDPHIGHIPVAEVGLVHADLVMAFLPEALSSATRRHVAQIVRRVLGLAVYPGRHREFNPIQRGWLPRVKSNKAKEMLYPDEDARLLGCGQIPLMRRLAYGMLAREGMRTKELARLKWRDVDLVRGKIYLDINKTDDPRSWALDPGVLAALLVWKEKYNPHAMPDDYVLLEDGVPINVAGLAKQFRRDLRKAGITRPQLFEQSPTRQAIRCHDLRATFVTVSLANGKTEAWVADRTGHRSSLMINRYRRKARTWSELELGALRTLAAAVPEFCPQKRACGIGSAPVAEVLN